MQYRNNKTRPAPIFRAREDSRAIRIILAQRQKLVLGLTLIEMVIAMAIITIILAAILPQFRVIQNSWDSEASASETLQNGRILIDHLNRNLSKAVRITAVSDSSETNGYIEFIDNDANNVRYDVNSISDCVEFGLIGSPSDLAGPVSKLQFTCYGVVDLSTPITDVNAIRSVKVETTLTNPASLSQDMTFVTQAYIRTNALPASGGDISKMSEPWLEFDTVSCSQTALCQIDQTRYLCVYQSTNSNGFAVVLTVDGANWSVSNGSVLNFDSKRGITPTLAKIDSTHFLCAYQGEKSDGFACILQVDPPDLLSKKGSIEYDLTFAYDPALCRIDGTHYLCTYEGNGATGWAVVLSVDTAGWTLQTETPFEFDASAGTQPVLAKVDATHFLCAYTGSGTGEAVILTVNPADWTIIKELPFQFDGIVAAPGAMSALAKIDNMHYLCTYTGDNRVGWGVVLTVNTADWTITKETPAELESVRFLDSALCQINNTDFFCGYTEASPGRVVVLTVNAAGWTITKGTPFDFEATYGGEPALAKVDGTHYLCAYEDATGIVGTAGVLELGGGILP